MNEKRIIDALKRLKEKIEEVEKSIKEDNSEITNAFYKNLIETLKDSLIQYTIVEGEWYKNGLKTGIVAEGKDGKPGKDGKDGKNGLPGKPGKDGKDGKNGLPGKPGKDGKDGKPGKDGKDGLPGKDGISPIIKIGKVKTTDDEDAKVTLRKTDKENEYILDITIPRGPRGYMGFDATINGKNTITIEAGDNIRIDQHNKKLIISGTAASVDLSNYYTKDEIDEIVGDIESILNEVV